jgi:hypothetical protein
VGDLGVTSVRHFPWFLAGCLLAGCGSSAETPESPAPGEPPGQPSAADLDVARLLGASGSTAPSYFAVYTPEDDDSGRPLYPTALDWNPTQEDELWITLREAPRQELCVKGTVSGCDWLIGRVAIVRGATQSPAVRHHVETAEDANAWHFMRRPTSIAFGDDETFATCAEARTSNYENEVASFNGPVLWSADPALFGATPPATATTGSTHLDMLHETPYCMGIAHERANAYWAFNGAAGALDRYDFHAPHGPGEDDHSDGQLERFVDGALSRVEDIPSHLAYDTASGFVYAADTGNGRLVVLDPAGATRGTQVSEYYDPIEIRVHMMGAKLSVLVGDDRLGMPSGLALYQGVLFVTDALSSRIVAYDRAGHTLATLDTGLPVGALAGISIGPDGRAYFADRSSGRVLRIDVP